MAGELTGSAKTHLEEHLGTCAACSAYLAQLRVAQEKFLQEHPFGSLHWVAERREHVPWFTRLTSALAVPVLRPVLIPLCLLMFAVVLIIPFMGKVQRENSGPDRAYKGQSTLSYIYKRSGLVHESAPSDTFFAGDAIQIFYSSKTEQYVSLFSIDSRGAVSLYQPDEHAANCSIRTGAGTKLAYPKSIVLDASHGCELVVALITAEPIATAQVKRWLGEVTAKSGGDMHRLELEIRAKHLGVQGSVSTLLLRKG
jgi:hypothetical protein